MEDNQPKKSGNLENKANGAINGKKANGRQNGKLSKVTNFMSEVKTRLFTKSFDLPAPEENEMEMEDKMLPYEFFVPPYFFIESLRNPPGRRIGAESIEINSGWMGQGFSYHLDRIVFY